jgi:hypothetical protein
MKTAAVVDAVDASVREASPSIAAARVAFLDNIRYLMVLLVLVYHSVAAYAIVAPHWVVHDTTSVAADIIRELFDVLWILARHSRAFAVAILALFVFCLAVRP